MEDQPTRFELQQDRNFSDPNLCADFIMDQLYDGPRHPDDGPPRNGEWVIAHRGGVFFPYREWTAIYEGYEYFRITYTPDGMRILEGEA